MIDLWHFRDLPDAEYLAWARRKTAELAALDRAIAEKESAPPAEEIFRAAVAREAVEALAALGVPEPAVAWWAAAVQTRVWILEIASPGEVQDLPFGLEWAKPSPTWVGPTLTPPESPRGEWLLFAYVLFHAQNVRDERLARKFGKPGLTKADFAEARLRCEIPNDQWDRVRSRALWVLAR